MIVRDEAHVVAETLESVAPHIDHWVVVDTGSKDSTPQMVRASLEAKGIPGELHRRPWTDFGTNRTEALELCRGKADYAWVIDADDLVVGDLDLSALSADSYLLRYGQDFMYWRKQLFRTGLPWRYVGAVHEYPVCEAACSEARLEGPYYVESRRLGARSLRPDRYQRDCEVLLAALERDPADARSTFYLAQSHFDAGDHRRALEWYTRRAQMGGWGEEVFYSLLRRAACMELIGEPWERVLDAYLESWQSRPVRAEPLCEIARHYRIAEKHDLAYMFADRACELPFPDHEVLFLSADVYRWRSRDELAVAAYQLGRYEESVRVLTELLDRELVPDDERERVLANRDQAARRLRNRTGRHPAEVVDRLSARRAGRSPRTAITLTITSGRRRLLFERTVNSFLRCCEDADRIGRWICVDTGSSPDDRRRMEERYPFFEFVFRDPPDASHADTMNLLLEMVQSPHWLHLEDDWHFVAADRYVEKALAILRDDPRIAQVAFNRNYGETLDCRELAGGLVRRTRDGGLRYRLHQYLDRATADWEEHLASLPAGSRTNAHWPHFTLRPSFMRAGAIRKVGRFQDRPDDPETCTFEFDFGLRYTDTGLRTAFLDTINCVHTGRLTRTSGDGPASAYELLEEGRPVEPLGERLEIRVVNLGRRPDRWQAFRHHTQEAAGAAFLERCRRSPAVDGRLLCMTPEIERIFRGNDFNYRHGIVGCALSHLGLWRQLAQSGSPGCLVLEDDVRLAQGFDRLLVEVCERLEDQHPDFDVALLGYNDSPDEPVRTPVVDQKPRVREVASERPLGGAYAYVVSSEGARRLLELVERDGIQNGIDIFLMRHAGDLEMVESDPTLAVAPLAFANGDVDSDIQHDFAPLVSREAGPSAMLVGPPIGTLHALVPSVAIGEFAINVDTPWPCSDPAIAADGDGFRMIVRSANHWRENGRRRLLDGERLPKTSHYLVRLDGNFGIAGVDLIRGRAESTGGNRALREDMRLLSNDGDWWAVADVRAHHDDPPNYALLTLEDAEVARTHALGPAGGGGLPAPFVVEGSLHVISAWSPITVRRLDSGPGARREVREQEVPAGVSATTAASPGLAIEGGWMFVVRESGGPSDGGPRHRLVLLNNRYRIAGLSPWFRLLGRGEERCCGLARRGSDLLLSFGVDGVTGAVAILDFPEALGLLQAPSEVDE